MKRIIYLITVVFLFSCTRPIKKDWDDIKETCSIDLYQEYLINDPQTVHIIEVIDSLRVFWERKVIDDGHSGCHSNCLLLLINSNGQLLSENQLIADSELSEKIKSFILNPNNLPNLPEKKVITIKNLGEFMVSRGIIDIKSDRQLEPKRYSEVISSVKASLLEIRNEYAINIYGKELKRLNNEQEENIEKIVPIRIRFERYIPEASEFPIPADTLELVLELSTED